MYLSRIGGREKHPRDSWVETLGRDEKLRLGNFQNLGEGHPESEEALLPSARCLRALSHYNKLSFSLCLLDLGQGL